MVNWRGEEKCCQRATTTHFQGDEIHKELVCGALAKTGGQVFIDMVPPAGKTDRSGELVKLPRDELMQCLIRTNPESATGYEMANNMDQFKVEGSVCLLE